MKKVRINGGKKKELDIAHWRDIVNITRDLTELVEKECLIKRAGEGVVAVTIMK